MRNNGFVRRVTRNQCVTVSEDSQRIKNQTAANNMTGNVKRWSCAHILYYANWQAFAFWPHINNKQVCFRGAKTKLKLDREKQITSAITAVSHLLYHWCFFTKSPRKHEKIASKYSSQNVVKIYALEDHHLSCIEPSFHLLPLCSLSGRYGQSYFPSQKCNFWICIMTASRIPFPGKTMKFLFSSFKELSFPFFGDCTLAIHMQKVRLGLHDYPSTLILTQSAKNNIGRFCWVWLHSTQPAFCPKKNWNEVLKAIFSPNGFKNSKIWRPPFPGPNDSLKDCLTRVDNLLRAMFWARHVSF